MRFEFYYEGATIGGVRYPDTTFGMIWDGPTCLGSAYAHCAPEDNFCKSVGRKLVVRRILEGKPKELRKKVWEEYWKKVKR